MENITQEMREWLKHYLRSRDVFAKNIKEIIDKGDDIIVKYKDKERIFIVFSEIPEDFLLENHTTLVLLNTKKNFDWLLSKWNKISSYEDLNTYFINPLSVTEKRWIVYPHSHNKITEKTSLKPGLKALFSMVDVYTDASH